MAEVAIAYGMTETIPTSWTWVQLRDGAEPLTAEKVRELVPGKVRKVELREESARRLRL